MNFIHVQQHADEVSDTRVHDGLPTVLLYLSVPNVFFRIMMIIHYHRSIMSLREKRSLTKSRIHRKRPTQQFLTSKTLKEGTICRKIFPMTSVFLRQTANNLLLFRIKRHQHSQHHHTRDDLTSNLVMFLQTGECEELFVVVEEFFQIVVMNMLKNAQVDEVF